MRFHSVHGANVLVDEGGKRATRLASFCDAIAFSAKPVAVGTRLSLQLTSNEAWTGALRLGLTSHDPAGSSTSGGGGALPRFSCPDLASRQGYWVRPLPERWIAPCSKLTFYVNAQGHFQLFVDSEYKGALLSGLPVKERLWLIVDLYGISVSAKFVTPCSSAPVEVVARGPEAVRAYRQACAEGSVPLYRTRLYIVGCPGAGKSSLKEALLNAPGRFLSSQPNLEKVPQRHLIYDYSTRKRALKADSEFCMTFKIEQAQSENTVKLQDHEALL
ncbi:hypothetical protein HPB48_008320 [Haemaphysalis longicornis]|uniref:NHR domain-containing protein n=1 Tax=Haemaphysalis longicornis TaxID=44386 RepID=A0A9J6FW24_HAELO|nr:hypothetical protein HPB48_008320 [Haemaphysalis longicornis]